LIDLAALKREAESADGDRTVVDRSWLRQALAELTAGRKAQARLGQVFGNRGRPA
jgi:hypothetical protein